MIIFSFSQQQQPHNCFSVYRRRNNIFIFIIQFLIFPLSHSFSLLETSRCFHVPLHELSLPVYAILFEHRTPIPLQRWYDGIVFQHQHISAILKGMWQSKHRREEQTSAVASTLDGARKEKERETMMRGKKVERRNLKTCRLQDKYLIYTTDCHWSVL